MDKAALKLFRYELALGKEVPVPKPQVDYHSNSQYCIQQFLHALCKEHVGSLGKRNGKWEFGPDAPASVKLSSRPDIKEQFDFAEELGIIVPAEGGENAEGFTPYQLSKASWEKFDKFAS